MKSRLLKVLLMDFEVIPGLTGKVYVPPKHADCMKKNPCGDCHFCQFCSDDRCCICQGEKKNLNPECCSRTEPSED